MRNSILIILACFFLAGCAVKPCEPIIRTEYVEVKIPVAYTLKRPSRPLYVDDMPIPVYLNEVLVYTRKLEGIIDATNR